MLIFGRKVGQIIHIGDNIQIRVHEIQTLHGRQRVKLAVHAPVEVKVYREEIWERIQKEKEAAKESAQKVSQSPVIGMNQHVVKTGEG